MSIALDVQQPKLTRKDFVSDQAVRWCPGCGDYAILAQVQKVMPDLGVPKENIVFISGIGCSSRFPYYMDTYGIHSIHGRAPTVATGLKISNPDLNVWVITGDGDGLSIGGNHLLHACRRNVDLNIVLFNNRIYGLTKGQYSPTSRTGHKTKSSPMGSLEQPLNPIALALASEATFIARTIDAHVKHLAATLEVAAAHKGVSFLEVYQNCIIFNPNEWVGLDDRKVRDDNILYLEHGKPMVFGKNNDKGIRLVGFRPEVVELGDEFTEDDLLVHDETSLQLAYILSSMEHPEYPAPMGVIRRVEKPTYTAGLLGQVATAQMMKGEGDLDALFRSADMWEVKDSADGTAQMAGTVSSELEEQYIDEIDQSPAGVETMADHIETDPIAVLQPKTPISVTENATVANAVRQMNMHNIGCVVVTDGAGVITGIVTENDVLMRVAGGTVDLTQTAVSEVMTADPMCLSLDSPLAQAFHLMSVHGFRHLPLVDEEYHPVGVISSRDVVRYLKENFA